MPHSLLLLGGNGFIGQALARRYAKSGYTVHIVSRHKVIPSYPGIYSHTASLDDPQVLDKLLPLCDVVIHTASTCTPGASATRPSKEGEENLLPLMRLLEILSRHSPRQLIYISSGGTVYGNPTITPVGEAAPLSPISYHGAAKAAAELFLQVFAHSGYPVAVLRPANVYGPEQQGPEGFGIIRAILQHLKSDIPMEIWGDGNTLRDYLYIDDLVEAVMQVQQQHRLGAFNVGTGLGHSVNEVVKLAESTVGRKLLYTRQPARSMDVKSVVLDYAKLNRATGWKPHTQLETGLRQTWAWLSEQP
jgi:UDP-glucose 4-epimerase